MSVTDGPDRVAMPTPVYSQRILGFTALVGFESMVVPVNYYAVVRCFDVVIPAATIAEVSLTVNGYPVWFYISAAGSAPVHAQWQGRQVARSGETIEVETTDTAGGILMGYLLALP